MLKNLYPLALAAVLLTAPAMALAQEVTHTATAVQPGAYSVEPYHTRVLFSVNHMGFTTWYGEFAQVSGNLNLTPNAVSNSTLQIHIPVATISTNNAKLDGELKSPAWFDAAKYPDITFVAEKIISTGKGKGLVTGSLTLHGVTKPVTLAVKFNGAGVNVLDKKYTVGFEVSGKIKRSDFGVKTYVPLIGDEVDLIISAAFEHA